MKNLPRWLFASIAEHFRVIAAANNIPYFVEGLDERSDEDMQISHSELRVTGPAAKEQSNGHYHIDVTINFMLTSMMDMTGNAYELVQWGGDLQEEMLAPIPIYKYGTGPKDTGRLLGCLRVKGGKKNKVQLYHFGQMSTTDRVRQSELDAVYELWTTSAGLAFGDLTTEGGVDPADPFVFLPPADTLGLTSGASSILDLPRSIASSAILNSIVGHTISPSAHTFISEWKTDNFGSTNDDQIELPLEASGTYNFDVDWGDGDADNITTWNEAATTHTYPSSGNYTVTITGTLNGWRFNDSGDRKKIVNVSNWGILNLGNSGGYFYGCEYMTCNSINVLVLGTTSNMSQAFEGCSVFNPDVSGWDTQNTTNMFGMLRACAAFDQDPGSWDVSKVTDMTGLFYGCTAFDQDISSWNTSNVVEMSNMLRDCPNFDQDISGWDVSSTVNMVTMLYGSALSTSNYDSLLVAWDAQAVQSGVTFHAGSSTYSAGSPAASRAHLISSDSWLIQDGGPA